MAELKMDASTEELIAEMQKVLDEQTTEKDDDPGLTAEEWSETWNMSIKTTRIRLRKLFKLGKLINGQAVRPSMDGRAWRCPVYRVITE